MLKTDFSNLTVLLEGSLCYQVHRCLGTSLHHECQILKTLIYKRTVSAGTSQITEAIYFFQECLINLTKRRVRELKGAPRERHSQMEIILAQQHIHEI